MNPTLATLYTLGRPYSSDSGANTIGPAAKPSTYTDTQKEPSSGLALPNSRISAGTPGANMAGGGSRQHAFV